MTYTLGEAAKATGNSKTTIHRAIKSGRVSATRKDDGSYEIDPAELHRVFPPKSAGNGFTNDNLEQTVTRVETEGLRREIDLLRERLTDKDRVIEDLRHDRDHARDERDRLLKVIEEQAGSVRLLTDQTRTPAAEPERPARRGFRGFLHRLTG
jgi:predicted site-specific integrase-resolvase